MNNGLTSKWYSARGILDNVEISPAATIAKILLQVMLLPILHPGDLVLLYKKNKEKKERKKEKTKHTKRTLGGS